MAKAYIHCLLLLLLLYTLDFLLKHILKNLHLILKIPLPVFFISPNILYDIVFFSLNICECQVFYHY